MQVSKYIVCKTYTVKVQTSGESHPLSYHLYFLKNLFTIILKIGIS